MSAKPAYHIRPSSHRSPQRWEKSKTSSPLGPPGLGETKLTSERMRRVTYHARSAKNPATETPQDEKCTPSEMHSHEAHRPEMHAY
jgi:hypothetical protein